MKRPRQIVALGGGMFSMEPENGLLDKYVLNLALKERPKICFLGTASNDGPEYREMFYKFFNVQNCEPSHLSFLDPPANITKFILDQDIIHVGGGNTKLIMEIWKKFGVDRILKRAWNSGVILTGMSAGAICWFEDGITNPEPGKLDRLPCLGILKGSFCPHYDDRAELKSAFHKLISEGTIKEGFGVEDGAALHFVDKELIRVVTSNPNATAFKVAKVRNKIVETKLSTFYLGKISETKTDNGKSEEIETLNTAIKYIEKINKHDVNGIADILTPDHKFIDSTGIVCDGKRDMKKAWKGFFSWFPDYEITVLNTLLTNDTVGFFGYATGSFYNDINDPFNKFKIPAAWRAKIRNNLISEWQVFADNEIVRNIIDDNGRKEIFKEHVLKTMKR